MQHHTTCLSLHALGSLAGNRLLLLSCLLLRLGTHDPAAPLPVQLLAAVVEVAAHVVHKLRHRTLVLLADTSEGKRGGGLLVHDGTEASLPLDDAIRHVHLAAERRKPHHDLNRVHIVSDDDKGRLLLLDEGRNVVDSALHKDWLLRLGSSSSSSLSLSSGLKALILLLLGLRSVLVQQLEHLRRGVLVHRASELVHSRGDLEALVKDSALTLKTHILWPLNEARHVLGGLDIVADAEVLWPPLEQRVLRLFLFLLAGRHRSGCCFR
mmetsp:Transcript_32014/g.66252  ORF Transcript_32014/g.66252 Transcript_32014/m.66252 type:complete len:267 (-) Transcript_32014:30-830(-)